jgi:hypothetical protein
VNLNELLPLDFEKLELPTFFTDEAWFHLTEYICKFANSGALKIPVHGGNTFALHQN